MVLHKICNPLEQRTLKHISYRKLVDGTVQNKPLSEKQEIGRRSGGVYRVEPSLLTTEMPQAMKRAFARHRMTSGRGYMVDIW